MEDEGQRAERVGRGRIYPLAPASLRSKFPAPGINWLMLSGYPAEGAWGSDVGGGGAGQGQEARSWEGGGRGGVGGWGRGGLHQAVRAPTGPGQEASEE